MRMGKDNDFEVKIYQDWGKFETIIYFLNKSNKTVINLFSGEVYSIKGGEPIPDNFIMKISPYVSTQIFSALAEALDKQGVKTENDFKIQGLLEATKYHLEDMRKLVFKKT